MLQMVTFCKIPLLLGYWLEVIVVVPIYSSFLRVLTWGIVALPIYKREVLRFLFFLCGVWEFIVCQILMVFFQWISKENPFKKNA
jgi:hypothetical protein